MRECAIEEVLWRDFPDVPPETVAGAWAAFKDKASVLARSSARSVERERVHLVLTSIVECAMGGECHLKYWYEKKPLDAFPTHNIIPAFSFTATNDASLATIALQVLLEAKLEHDVIFRGGFTTFQAQQMLREMRGLHIVGGDVVEVSPPFDPSGVTAHAGVTMMFEILCPMAEDVAKCRG